MVVEPSPVTTVSSVTSERQEGLPGGLVQGTENLTGVLVATVRDPSKSGPGAKLHNGLTYQGKVGVAGNPPPFHASTGVPPRTSELHRRSDTPSAGANYPRGHFIWALLLFPWVM